MKFNVCVHLLNDEEEEFECPNLFEALQDLGELASKYDASQVQFYQIAPVHEQA